MSILIFLILAFLAGPAEAMAAPKLVAAASAAGWTNPVYSPDGQNIAYTDASFSRIMVREAGEDSARELAHGDRIGRRFVFEPSSQRIVYRQQVNAIPTRPWRLISTSIILYDPAMITHNDSGEVFGPYLIDHEIWYRSTLFSPFASRSGKIQLKGPYFDRDSGALWVRSAKGDTVFSSAPEAVFAGAEISPDGQWVAAVQTEPSMALLIISTSGGNPASYADMIAPSWAGNAKSLICIHTVRNGPDELVRIWIPSMNSFVEFVSDQFEPDAPALNEDGSKALFVSKGAIYETGLEVK